MTSRDVLCAVGAGTLFYHAVAIIAEFASRLRAGDRRFGNLFPAAAAAVGGNPRPPRAGISIATFVVIAYAIGALVYAAAANASPTPSTGTGSAAASQAAPAIEVHFSPSGGCTTLVTQLIDSARSTVRIAAYQFTSEPIAAAVVSAHARHVDVQLIVDPSSAPTAKHRASTEVVAAGVSLAVDHKHHIFHDKYVVVDGSTLETGSFNFTESAEKSNAENCLVIRDAAVAEAYAKNWAEHAVHSVGGGQ